MHLQNVQRAVVVLAFEADLLDFDEAVLLYDINQSSNPNFPYWEYQHFNIEIMSDDECKAEFRFLKRDIQLLHDKLQIPQELVTANGSKFDGIEALCILLRRLAYPCRYSELIPRFGRSVPELSGIFNEMLDLVYNRWHHLLTSFNQNWLAPQQLEVFCEKNHEKGSPLENCWGFIDGTVRPISRPSTNQRIVYNGHKRVHALKFQSVLAPNGLIGNLYGPIEGKRHDAGMLRESNLLNDLRLHSFDRNNSPLCLYGDPAYPLNIHLIGPFKGINLTNAQKQFNSDMSSVRVAVEWGFGKVTELFKFVDFKKNLTSAKSSWQDLCSCCYYFKCTYLHIQISDWDFF